MRKKMRMSAIVCFSKTRFWDRGVCGKFFFIFVLSFERFFVFLTTYGWFKILCGNFGI